MYKHILLPTDGSALSEHAVVAGMSMAKTIGARVTGLHVTPKLVLAPLDSWAHGGAKSQPRLKAIFARHAQRYLAFVDKAAKDAGVPCQCLQVADDSPYAAILRTAQNKLCDLIFMASHGRKGSSALVLGSETVKVLTHSSIPVMVHREAAAPYPISTLAPKRGSRRR